MSESGPLLASPPRPALTCRLYQQSPGNARRCFAGVVEITNLTPEVMMIPWNHHPLQYLDLQVFNEAGNEVGEYRYGELFNPIGMTEVLHLQPGETYTHTVHLLDVLPKAKWVNGTYTIKACYRFGGQVAWADPLQIEVTDETVR